MQIQMKRVSSAAIGFVAVVGVLTSPRAAAQPSTPGQVPEHIEWLESRLDEFEREFLGPWQWQSRVSLGLVVLVAALGAVAGLMKEKDSKRSSARRVATYVGAAAAVLTVVHQTAFAVDYRAMNRVIARARVEIQQIRQLASPQYHAFATPEMRDKWYEIVKSKMDGMGALEYSVVGPTETASIGLFARAMAQEVAPAWVASPPQNVQSIAFVGRGEATDIATAEAASVQDARAKGAAHFVAATPPESGLGTEDKKRLSEDLIESAAKADAFVGYDAATKRYSYFTLLRISRNAVRTGAEIFALKHRSTPLAKAAGAMARETPRSR